MASTGVASRKMKLVAYMRPDEQRQAEPGQARGAHPVDGDDEVQPREDRREAGDDDADQRQARRCSATIACCRACRRSSRYRRRRPAWPHSVQTAAEHEEVPAQQVEPREGQVLGADHHRQAEIAQHGRDHRHQEEEHHDDAVQR